MYRQFTYTQAVEKAEHFKALNHTKVYIEAEWPDTPWHKAERIECGGSYRLNGPTSFYVVAHDAGLTFQWSIDMERRDANGRGVSLFDRDRLREVARKLPPAARAQLSEFFSTKVLLALRERTLEIREALNTQMDSEDCVRGLIAFADDITSAV